jgi:hypothetical protein
MLKRCISLLAVAALAATAAVSTAGLTSAATPGADSLFGDVSTTKFDKPNTDGYEIGTVFTPRVSGTISAMRFYRATKCDYGNVYGMLYRGEAFQSAAVKLGTTAAVNYRQTTSPIGWQTLKFPTPLTVTAGTRYTITRRLPHNCNARMDGSFTSARTIGNFDTPARATIWRKDKTGSLGADTASYLTDFIFAAAAPATVTDVRAFGAVGDGVTDDADAIQRALYAMKAGDTLVFPAGYTFRHTAVSTNVNPWVPGRVLTVVTPNVRITGGGTLLATSPGTSEFYLHADNVSVDNLTFRTTGVTARAAPFEAMGLRIGPHTGVSVTDVTVDGPAGAGFYVGGASNFTVTRVQVRNSWSDAIHITGGSHDGVVNDCTATNSGDDGFAVVSYRNDPINSNITINNPKFYGQTWGRAFSVVGGDSIRWNNVYAERSDAAAIYVAAESEWDTWNATNVTFNGATLVNSNTDPAVDHGAVLIYNSQPGTVNTDITLTNVAITGTRSTASRNVGVINAGGVNQRLSLAGFTISAGPDTAFYANTGLDAYNRSGWTVNGSAVGDLIGWS